MITVDDATGILNRFSLDRITSVKLKDSFGRVLAGDIISGIDVPSFDRSDMDGYAIRDQDLMAGGLNWWTGSHIQRLRGLV